MVKKAARSKTLRRPKPVVRVTTSPEKIAATIAAIQAIKPATPKAEKLTSLLNSWLSDDSGYDEEAWPQLKKALDQERSRVGARRLFNG